MGIKIEFNPELALRDYTEFRAGRRKESECIPEKLETNKVYEFTKEEQRNFWMLGEIPLIETKGGGVISRPIATVQMMEVVHFLEKNVVYTKGKYKVIEIFHDDKVHFEGTDKIGTRFTASYNCEENK